MTILEYIRNKTGQEGITKSSGVWFCAPYRNDTHPSLEVSESLGKWHDWGSGESGDIYNLVQKCENCDFKTAKSIVGEQKDIIPYEKKICPKIENISTNNHFYHTSLIDYARKRCVSCATLRTFCVEVIKDKFYYIGLKNDSGGYALRNEFFKGQLGANDITTLPGVPGNKTALVFEGMFDFLSFRSCVKCPQDCTYIVLNTTQNINKIDVRKYDTIHLYLDNDDAGDIATKKIIGAIDHRQNYCQYGDVNDFICNKFAI